MKKYIEYPLNVRSIIDKLDSVFILDKTATIKDYVTALGFLINKYKYKSNAK